MEKKDNESQAIKAYKGFERDLKCRGFQYEVGKEYETDDAVICETGFHACENPLDVTDYYFMDGELNMSRFCKVELSGKIDKYDSSKSTKLASSKIKIKSEIKFGDLVRLGVEWIRKNTLDKNTTMFAHISSSDESARIGSVGGYTCIASSGRGARIYSGGGSERIASSGMYAHTCSGGDYAQIASCGGSDRIYGAGDYAQMASSGDYGRIYSAGDRAQIASSGDYGQIASAGACANIGTSGYCGRIYSAGDRAQIASSGDSAKVNSEGEDSVICCTGYNSVAKARKGSWITLSEWAYDSKKEGYVPVCVKTEQVDGERIKEGVFYRLVDGEFAEAD